MRAYHESFFRLKPNIQLMVKTLQEQEAREIMLKVETMVSMYIESSKPMTHQEAADFIIEHLLERSK